MTKEMMTMLKNMPCQEQRGMNMKTIVYKDRSIELTRVWYRYGNDVTMQEGILLHDTSDKFSDGDTIYGNCWTIDAIEDESDLENLLTSSDGTTYFRKVGCEIYIIF